MLSQRNKACDPDFWTRLDLRSGLLEHPVDEECISSLVSLQSVNNEVWKREWHCKRLIVKMLGMMKFVKVVSGEFQVMLRVPPQFRCG